MRHLPDRLVFEVFASLGWGRFHIEAVCVFTTHMCFQAILQHRLRSWHQLCTDSHVRLCHRLSSHKLAHSGKFCTCGASFDGRQTVNSSSQDFQGCCFSGYRSMFHMGGVYFSEGHHQLQAVFASRPVHEVGREASRMDLRFDEPF